MGRHRRQCPAPSEDEARDRILALLFGGKIHTRDLGQGLWGQEGRGQITLNTNGALGIFNNSKELALTLAHESEHVEQRHERSFLENVFAGFLYKWSDSYKIAIESAAEGYAQRNYIR